jgi:hypothetical protein
MRTILPLLCAISTAPALYPQEAKERKPPKRPPTPFAVWVQAEPRGEPEIEEKILRAKDLFEESVDRRDEWFRRVEDRDEADIVVELKALFIEDENRSDARTSRMGDLSHTSEYIVDQQRFTFYAVATLFGNATELRGAGERKEKDAASALVRQLALYVKKNYWQLLERQELGPASGVPTEQVGREWIVREIMRRVEALGASTSSVEWANQTLVVGIEPSEFQFPFSPSGFDDCLRTVECQRQMVEQVMDHLERALGKN